MRLIRKCRWRCLFAFALVLTVVRTQYDFDFVESRTWVILASIFIFRTIVFLKQKEKFPDSKLIKRFNYFFLFPNIFAPLFPIVDYKDYSYQTHKEEESNVRVDGVNLICLGVIQLLIYRLLYTYLLPTNGSVNDMLSLVSYISINYLLVFRLMGLLSISVGVLRLFGFKLPEIFNNIFIATGVSDFFRRLNIYWKEFLLNNFYYPIYFKYRKSGMFKALGIAAVITFLLNWFFHAYQWFWILGTSPIRWTDTIFWSAFSIVAIVEMLYQAKSVKKKENELAQLLLWPLKVLITFSFIATIWSLWTAPSVSYWMQMIGNAFRGESRGYMPVILGSLVFYALGLLFKKFLAEDFEKFFVEKRSAFLKTNFFVFCLIGLLTFNSLNTMIGKEFGQEIISFSKWEKNTDDLNNEAEGYYDGILEFNIGSANWDQALEEDRVERTNLGSLQGDSY